MFVIWITKRSYNLTRLLHRNGYLYDLKNVPSVISTLEFTFSMVVGANKVVPLPLWTKLTGLYVEFTAVISGLNSKLSVWSKVNVIFAGVSSKRFISYTPPLLLFPIWILVVPSSNSNVPALNLPPLEINRSTFVSLWPPPIKKGANSSTACASTQISRIFDKTYRKLTALFGFN